MKKILAVFLTFALVLSILPTGLFGITASAEEVSGYYTYEISEDQATITACDSEISGDITIPSELGGYPVTSIDYSAFAYCANLTGVIIPDSVKTIDGYAFEGCENLKNVTIGNNVTSIGNGTFFCCYALESVAIGNSVESIGNDAFYDCSSLKSINIPDSVKSIGSYAFEYCSALESITIGKNVESIGTFAFSCCFALESVTLGESVKSIDDNAFYYCMMSSITIPKSVTSIGKGVFDQCTELTAINVDSNNTEFSSQDGILFNKDKTELVGFPAGKNVEEYTIPNNVTSIRSNAFSSCENITSITIPKSVTSVGDDVFYDCYNLESINVDSDNTEFSSEGGVLFNKDKTKLICYPQNKTDETYIIPSSVESILTHAFYDCGHLKEVTLPTAITSVESETFYYCSGIESIEIPNGVTSIDGGAFEYCSSLTNISIPDSVTSIGRFAFDGTGYYDDPSNWENGVLYIDNHLITADSEISGDCIIKEGTKTISSHAFAWCYELTGVTIPDSVVNIGDDAFYDCDGLLSATIGNGVISLSESMFTNCTNLKSVTIGNSVQNISDYAFCECESIESITLPDSVKTIGAQAFCWCTNLKSINIPDGVTSIGAWAFGNCRKLNGITLPDSLERMDEGSFSSCESLESIVIPDGVTSIDGPTFYYCYNLKNITIPKSVTIIDNAFYGCDSLTNVWYRGSKADKENINIDSNATELINATWYYNFGSLTAEKEDLKGNLKFLFITPIDYEIYAGATDYGVEVSRSLTSDDVTDIRFENGQATAIQISNISLYNITRKYIFKPYAIVDGEKVYSEFFTSSYADFLVSRKDGEQFNAEINNILDTYAAVTGKKLYEGQVPNLEAAPAGNWVASTAYSEIGEGELGLTESNPVQGSLVGGKLRVNFNLPTDAENNGVLVYKSGNEFNADDVSNADADITFESGDIRSIDISNIAFENIAKQYTFVPYEYDAETGTYEFGMVSKVSFADFVARALDKGNASMKAQAYGICKAYKAAYSTDLCKTIE